MKAFVAGATGRTGKRIVQVLTEQEIPVVALVRDRAKAKEILPANVELVVGDLANGDRLAEAMQGCSAVLSAAGAMPSLDFTEPFRVDYWGTNNLIDAAKIAEIEHFVLVSSLCVSQFFHPLNLFWLVLYWKSQAEKDLQKSGLTYTVIRPGGLLDTDNEEAIVAAKADTLSGGRIPRLKVAQVSVAALFEPASHNKIVEIVAEPDAQPQDWKQLFLNV
ncbi:MULTISPECIES: SDR family oxidoreductase [Spirulina sp. CCY15215]|uniref:SDR family oxidoreductase n=1 Tax=Spirulina sp. CCY15215 TaxID=2767591 RepID=UPI00194F6EFD|nr:SDR family oxidoreductase [Spirulina major]